MSRSPTLFSGSGPVGLPPVPWTEKTIEREVGRAKDLSAPMYRGADESFSVQGTGGSPTGTDPENRVGDQDVGSAGRPVSSVLQGPGGPFPSWSG
jgi:hypothetical protein